MKLIKIEKVDDGVRADFEINNSFLAIHIRREGREIAFLRENSTAVAWLRNLADPPIRKISRKLKAIGLKLPETDIERLFSLMLSAGLLQMLDEEGEGRESRLREGDEEDEDESEEIRKRAEDILNNPHLLQEVRRILDKRIVGETDVKLLLFLIFASKEIEPQSTLLVAESSTGKSYLVHQIAEIFSEDVLWFSRVTPAALDRLGRDLTGKVLVIEEEAGINPEAEAIIRAWISEGKLRLLTTVKDENGNITTEEIETTGRPVIVSTTTKARIDEERATRIWILTPDTSKEQTKRILEFEALLSSGLVKDTGDEDFAVLRTVMKILKEDSKKGVKVLIPYANRLAESFPMERTRARRDFKKLLALIKVSAYLHQRNRPVVEDEEKKSLLRHWLIWLLFGLLLRNP